MGKKIGKSMPVFIEFGDFQLLTGGALVKEYPSRIFNFSGGFVKNVSFFFVWWREEEGHFNFYTTYTKLPSF